MLALVTIESRGSFKRVSSLKFFDADTIILFMAYWVLIKKYFRGPPFMAAIESTIMLASTKKTGGTLKIKG